MTRAITSGSTPSASWLDRCPGRACARRMRLLALCDKFGAGRVEAACQTALAFDVIDVRRIKRMVSTGSTPNHAE